MREEGLFRPADSSPPPPPLLLPQHPSPPVCVCVWMLVFVCVYILVTRLCGDGGASPCAQQLRSNRHQDTLALSLTHMHEYLARFSLSLHPWLIRRDLGDGEARCYFWRHFLPVLAAVQEPLCFTPFISCVRVAAAALWL